MTPNKHHGAPCATCGGTLRYVTGNNCVTCAIARAKLHYRANAEKARSRARALHQSNAEKTRNEREALNAERKAARKAAATRERERLAEVRKAARVEYHSARYLRERERICAMTSAYAKANRHVINASTQRYRAATLKRTPAWADLNAIRDVYLDAATHPASEPMHVDHVIPLQGRNVSGLHVVENLRVIPGSENCAKCNRFDPD